MSTEAKSELQRALERLVRDLQWKKKLCCAEDYDPVTVEELNKYIHEHGPLQNPFFGELSVFWIDDGYFIPAPVPVEFSYEVRKKILWLLRNWDARMRKKGGIIFSQGDYIFDERTGTPTTVRTPDISYIPRHYGRDLSNRQLWYYAEEPYNPSFVVEINKLSGEKSQLNALDLKMRNQFFRHGVQLGWLIDPRPGCQKMYEYKRDEYGKVYRVDTDEWRDLDGGAVLPGFCVLQVDLEMAMDPDVDERTDDVVEEGLKCPFPDCDEELFAFSALIKHVNEHKPQRIKNNRKFSSQCQ